MKKRKFADGGIFREGMDVPQDIDGASAPMPKRPMPKRPMLKRPMPKRPMPKRPMPKGNDVFREGIDVPQDIDGASAPRMPGMKKGGAVKGMHRMPDGKMMKDSDHKGMKHGGSVGSASKRADGIATKGKTKGKFI